MMIFSKVHRVIFFALCCALLSLAAPLALAQESSSALPVSENFDTEVYLVLASNERPGETPLPASLDQVVKQLRGTLAFKNYSLAATLINRVRNNGSLNLTWIGGPRLAPPTSMPGTTLGQLTIGQLKVFDSAGGPTVQISRFSFGAKVPIQTGTNMAPTGTNSAPVINYEQVGLSSDFSVRPDQPTIVGTLTVGPAGDAIIVVLCARRVQR
ncbi:MAG TPA: hypothetical protein VK475_08475 [Pyrinomonadaceae bacterium]|nr:hypothetical protein [Pyrinomonadaceae bacterium]